MSDGPNGVRGTKFFNGVPAACFPCGTAMGATMNETLLYQAGELMAKEAKAKGAHVILGPTVNMQRSPLGGRGFESFSEDPVVSGSSAAAIIKGMQNNGIQACLKHYVGNDQEDERRAVDAQIPMRALREVYLRPFQIAVRDASPGMMMTAYNKVNGTHVAESEYLLEEVLRKEWGWDGAITSDWYGTYSTSLAVKAGLDVEMPGSSIWRGNLLDSALGSRDISINDIENRARAMIKLVKKAMVESGIPENAPEGKNDNEQTSRLLRDLAAESIVLLKNEDDILPLAKDKLTAVIGPNGKTTAYSGGGSASLLPYYKVTPFDGISSKTTDVPLYTVGLDTSLSLPLIGEHLTTEDGNPGFIFRTYDAPLSDPNKTLVDTIHLLDSFMFMPDYKPDVPEGKPFYVNITGYFTPDEDASYNFGLVVTGTACLYVNDKLVVDNETSQRRGEAFFGTGTVEEVGSLKLKKGETYKITVTFGSSSTSKLDKSNTVVFGGALRVGMRKQTDSTDEIQKAVEIAKKVDQVVLSLGLNSDYESEGFDRKNMDLPPNIDKLVEAVTQANPQTVVVMQSGTPVSTPWIDKVKGFVQAWYGGNETGNGIADVIFGDVTPSGKLPLTFPKFVEDNPAYLNFASENGVTVYGENVYIGYRYYEAVKREVLFPFGYGLSYTRFAYNNIKVRITPGKGTVDPLYQELEVDVDVTNVGKVQGKEAVQVYITQQNPSIRRPNKELKAFEKVDLQPNETKTVTIKTSLKYACSYWDDSRNKWIMEKDKYMVHVASHSADIKASESFELDKTKWWAGV